MKAYERRLQRRRVDRPNKRWLLSKISKMSDLGWFAYELDQAINRSMKTKFDAIMEQTLKEALTDAMDEDEYTPRGRAH